MGGLRAWVVFPAVVLTTMLVNAHQARASCGGDSTAKPCGNTCIAEDQECCTDLGSGLQWVCNSSTCGTEYQKCNCPTSNCLGCTADLPCPANTMCATVAGTNRAACYTVCAGGGTCPVDSVCYVGQVSHATACCDAPNTVCGGEICLSEEAICCDSGVIAAPYGCERGTHRCGKAGEEGCVFLADGSGIFDCSSAPLPSIAMLVLGLVVLKRGPRRRN